MQAVYPGMKRRGWGRIVNFGSPAAQQSNPMMVAYNANKQAIRALSIGRCEKNLLRRMARSSIPVTYKS